MASKIGKIVWGIIIGIFIVLFIVEVCFLAKQFSERAMTKDTKWLPQDELPYPSLAICAVKPVNELAVYDQNTGFRVQKPRFIRYLKNLLTPLAYDHEKLPNSEADSTAAAKDFKRYLNETGRNSSSVESLLHSCEEIVSGCSVGGKEFSGTECCQTMTYMATPAGVCLIRRSQESQEQPGLKHGMRFRLKVDQPVSKGRNQGDNQGFKLFLFDKETPLSSIHSPLSLNSRTATSLSEMELGSKKRLMGGCMDRRGWNKRKQNEEMKQGTEKRFSCLESRIKEDCGCVPLLSLWKRSDEEKDDTSICTVNQTEHCANKWLGKWSIDLEAEMDWRSEMREKDRLCKPVLPCHHLFWNIKETTFPIKPKPGTIQMEVSLFYRHMVVRVETGHYLMTVEDLIYDICLAVCVLFVLFHFIYYIVTGIQNCCCAKKKTEQAVEPTYNKPMTGLVSPEEKYQHTQTEA